METEFKAGVRNGCSLDMFSVEEKEIIKFLSSKDWFITRTENVQIAQSSYKLLLMKPSPSITNAFNLHREIVVAFSPYDSFEPRSIDAIEYLNIQELRLEEICSVLISKDNDVEQKVSTILKSNQEARVIIPFSYSEIIKNIKNKDYLSNKFRKNFYSRDLFAIQDPLKKDLYFFGRTELIHSIINKHLSGENAGIFGLRKTGKTSILYGVERALERKKSISVFIDCQTLHLKPWNIALMHIIQSIQQKCSLKKADLKLLDNYDKEHFVADYFYDDILTAYNKSGKKSILLIFDEVENITFDTSLSESWKSGNDFIKFWQIVRSTYQKYREKNIFTYLVTGTNPRCIEKPTINKVDNPIFAQFPPMYIPAFDISQTKEMLDKLGGYMGLKFNDIAGAKLVEDFGGHPLLMRQMCSFIHRSIDDDRPCTINKTRYEKLKDKFYSDENGFLKYAQMVLEVLDNWYNDEFQMLTWLSIGEIDTFNGLSELSPEYITHLSNYGIIEKSDEEYSFKIEALKLYLSNKNKYKKINLSTSEKQSEISTRRNNLEPKIRKIVRSQLLAFLGENEAKKKIINELYGSKKVNEYMSHNYSDFFEPNKHNIYLKNLFELIRKNWDCFKFIFDTNVEIFEAKSILINYYRKGDAHASKISDSDFQSFRGAMEWMEEKILNFLS